MSGAANCPETPRQRMIGMMYLVLTAMLALNVSSSILEGFSMVDSSLHKTIESATFRNNKAFADFADLATANPTKYKEWLDKAKLVKVKSDALYSDIETFKKDIVKMVDRDKSNDSAYVKQIEDKGNTDKPAQYAILEGRGKILKGKIREFSDFMVNLSKDDATKMNLFRSMFSTENVKQHDGASKSWEQALFEDVPVAAVITVLTKYQSDIRASEVEMVEFLKGRSDKTDLRVNKLEALVIPESKYVMKGDRYQAKIVLSAVDTTAKLGFTVNGASIQSDGRFGKYEVPCSVAGPKKFSGLITYKDAYGNPRTEKFESEYMVGEPTATMSNEDLNVVYKGIDNKFSVSVPGVAAANISVRVDGGTASQVSPGRFVIRAQRDGEIKINVFAKVNGKDQTMGSGNYRVKYLPNPTAFLLFGDEKQSRGGSINPSMLRSCTMIASYGQDELVKANFEVKSFTLIARGLAPQSISGTKIPTNFVDKLIKGDILMINNIKAVGPDQRVRDLGSMSFQL